MPVDFPYELFLEILSYIRSESPPTLAGLQVGLTCRLLYEEFRPLIAKVHLQKLFQQYEREEVHVKNQDSGNMLRFPIGQFIKHATLAVDPPHSQGVVENFDIRPQTPLKPFNFRFTFCYTPKTFDVDAIWACVYLLSNEMVSAKLSRFGLTMNGRLCRLAGSEPPAAWARALAKLLQVCASRKGCKYITLGTESPAAGSEQPGWEAREEYDLPIPSSITHLPEITLLESIDLPHLQFLCCPNPSTVYIYVGQPYHASLSGPSTSVGWVTEQPMAFTPVDLPAHRWTLFEKGLMKRLRAPPTAQHSPFLPNLDYLRANMALLLLFAEAELDFPTLTKLPD
ncbi:hypothetical protein FA13DRAFT_1790525 [Coprinellus micaceus]|uniref:Uncharacterized protein n=1 Tax=Coprinellus micaceus TaxID=71717 RepID=A0A4Y7TGY3_COPMI|nr:hypothetical protein FA13DRAFT_1790525 [Coprinellus micaceus]